MIRNEEKVDGVTYYDYDVEKANQILEDAGYTLAEDGYRYKDGEKLTIRFLANKDKRFFGFFDSGFTEVFKCDWN